MDDDRHDTYRSESEAVAELEALRRIREELWTALRGEDDPEIRISLLSRLSENRAAILRLGEELGLENPQTANIDSRAPTVEPPPQADDLDDRYYSYGEPTVTSRDSSDLPLPRSHLGGAHLGASQLDPSRLSAGSSPIRARSAMPTGQSRALQVHEPANTARWALLAVGGLVVLLAATWLMLARPFDGLFDGAASNVSANGSDSTGNAGDNEQVTQIQAVLSAMSMSTVGVEARDSTIFLTGTVATEHDKQSAIAAAQAIAGTTPVDGSELIVQAAAVAGPETTTDASRAEALQQEINRITAVTPVTFAQGESDLSELHIRILNNIATVMTAYQNIPITIVGFTDDLGNDDANRQLSEDRANNVQNYLVGQGVPEGQLTTEARGESTATGAAQIANLERRVEFEVVAGTDEAALAPNENQLRVAIVAPSAANDLAFTQSMVDAVAVIEAERGNIEVSISDNEFVPEEAAQTVRDYAAQGYDLVIAHGSQYGAFLPEIAAEFPDAAFAWGTASDTFDLPNVYAYDAAAEQGGYVQGAIASLLSGSGTIGVVGPLEVGDAQRYIDGFQAGAQTERPGTNVLVEYTGSFSETTLAAETAQRHVDAGADVMTGSAQMVVGAVSIASENNVYWFGTQANQASLAPNLVVSSQVYHWEVILRDIVSDIDNNTPSGENYNANLANGGLVIEFNPGVELPADVRERTNQIIAGIANGTVAVPVG